MPKLDALMEGSGLPAALHTEKVVLGAMLSDPIAVEDAMGRLVPEDFHLESHQIIFAAMSDMAVRNVPVDFVTLADHLAKAGDLERVTGRSYLISLTEDLPRHLSIRHYAETVRDKAVLRAVMRECEKAMIRATAGQDGALEVLNGLEQKLQEVHKEQRAKRKTLAEMCDAAFEELERQRSGELMNFVTSGLDDYDASHGGYAKGETTVIGARPRIGKSTLMRQGVIANCVAGNFVHLFTPEMDAGAVLRAIYAVMGGVPFHKVRHPERMTAQDWRGIQMGRDAVRDWPLEIDDTPEITAPEVIQRARSLKREKHTELTIIDYLQKMRFPGKPAERHIAITDAMISLTAFAKTEKVALVLVSSITEPSGKDRNRMPTLEDLRMSGDIRYEANSVLLLHRELDADSQKLAPETKLIQAKARSADDGLSTIYLDGRMQTFLSHDEYMRTIR